jgi:hypothetical protein
MFRRIDKSKGLLFCTYDLSQSLRDTANALRNEVENLDPNRLLNTAPEDLKAYLANKYRIESIRLQRDHWHAQIGEKQVDVRWDQIRRLIDDTSRPVMVPGERVEVRIPFEGESELFYSQPDNYTTSHPRAAIENQELVLRYDYPADNPPDVRQLIDSSLAEIERYLDWQRGMINKHNNDLLTIAAQAINDRHNRLLAQSHRAASLGIPIKRREDAPQTFAIPTVRKRAVPVLPAASTAPFTPEPAWAMEHYEQALRIIQNMTLVMERSPSAFKTMDEEALRQHFLVQLNGQFEGKATGETFNMEGKTDILLREGERNVFIAECKFWKGSKGFGEAIDQLLSYAAWRDTKTAILVFNRGTETLTVLVGVDATAKAHLNFKRIVNWPHESGYRYIFHANADVNRELTLTVLVFHVPQ